LHRHAVWGMSDRGRQGQLRNLLTDVTEAFSVAVCDSRHKHLAPVFDGLCEALQAHGYRHRRLPSHDDLFSQPALLAQVEVVAGFGDMPIGAEVLRAAPRLRGVVSCVSGTDGIDLAAATAANVLVAHAPTTENVRSMAEAAVLLLLHLFYDLDGTRENLRLSRGRPRPVKARMLCGKTIGIVGWGRISATLASLLHPWGVRLVVYSRRGVPKDLPAYAPAAPLDDVMANTDAVCVLAGAEANAPPIVDRAHIRLMKPTAYLVNLSRGSTVDEAALVDALQAGRIAGAALDVFATEPLPADSPLRTCPNVILTPHHVGHTQEGDQSLIPALVDNVLALLAGKVPTMVRNLEAVEAWRHRWAGRAANPMKGT
jgi:phosphoglycerate dehydrogenase-like enzyme